MTLVPYVVSRALFECTGWAANLLLPFARPQDPAHHPALRPWLSWDAVHYLAIARNGYPTQPGAFNQGMFPLLPLLLRSVGGSDAASLLLSFGLGLGGLSLMVALTRALFDAGLAARVAWIAALWPVGMIWSAVYTEGLFLALATGCLWGAWRGRPLVAGVLGILAGACRPPGVALLLPMLFLLPAGWARLAALGPPLGLVLFSAYLWIVTGDPLALAHSQMSHPHVAVWQPWTGVAEALRQTARGGGELTFELLFLPVLAGLVVALTRLDRWRGAALAMALAMIGPVLLAGTLNSLCRYAMVVFPLYWQAARLPTWVLAGIGIPAAVIVTMLASTGRLTP